MTLKLYNDLFFENFLAELINCILTSNGLYLVSINDIVRSKYFP